MRYFAFPSFILFFLLGATNARALPAYSRLYQAKYGYRASCVLCHTAGGGSAVTDYGRDFLRAGANFPAFAKLEGFDSDKDGATNLAEIRGRANAGDERSTILNPGDWLADQNKIAIPEKELRPLFPSADAFSAVEGTLKDNQISKVETAVGAPLSEEDKVPTFYFAVKEGKKFAVAEFLSASTTKGIVSIAVAMDVSGTVTSVRILKNPASKAIEEPSFLSQFVGKNKDAKWDSKSASTPQDDVSNGVVLAVKKAVFSINAVFSK